jgi:NTP pyrophosphatase (non-canonical NTP hydrolase)
MELSDYQTRAHSTAVWVERDLGIDPIVYCTLKLAGEAGEVADKVGKLFRDYDGLVNRTGSQTTSLLLELGDVLWYIANLAQLLGSSLDQVALMNLAKLAERKDRGTLRGSGDTR